MSATYREAWGTRGTRGYLSGFDTRGVQRGSGFALVRGEVWVSLSGFSSLKF
ncbi:hypothetical protein Dimus_002063 [Dionaea muscipula]